MLIRVNYFFVWFGFFFKKSNQINFFLKKTETEPKPVQTDRFRFGSVFLEQKQVQTGFARFFWFDSVFLVWLGCFPVWLCFFPGFFGLGSVFRFQDCKTETKPNRFVFF